MMRVKILPAETFMGLESSINNWLYDHPDVEVVDIKFGLQSGSHARYAAMVIYKQRGGDIRGN